MASGHFATLADVLPSVGAALGMAAPNPLRLTPNRDVVVLVVDGLGSELLTRHSDTAPTLSRHWHTTLVAGFPATTAVSLASLAMGAPCASHGIIGYSFALPGNDGDRVFNALRWRVDNAEGENALGVFPPESVQQQQSRLNDFARHGIDVHYVIPGYQQHSGLTRAVFRELGTLHPAATLADLRTGISEVSTHSGLTRRFAYAYYPDLDAAGHVHGPESPEWLSVLRDVDGCVADILTDMPSTCTLLVTGDHGMIRAGTVIDLESRLELQSCVRLIAGEARVRHIYLERSAARDEVWDRWRSELAGHAEVVSREQAIDEHWFGPSTPAPAMLRRMGDVIAVAHSDTILTLPTQEPMESRMLGHHGARTKDEQLIPLIIS